ncbi:hypothetical protein MUB24_22325 [Lederbergia sp. NSJ-179]|nr:hypothetical protein [Lederbergia sp. NSJ-179]MCJ7843560.1 hypothetical protein [Lederbergia sp. NSJ-179]
MFVCAVVNEADAGYIKQLRDYGRFHQVVSGWNLPFLHKLITSRLT